MNQYLLDTNICIHFIKGEYDLRSKIQRAGFGVCYVSEISIAELLYGVENSAPDRQAINRQRVADLRTAFGARVLPVGACLAEYARQKARLRKMGRRVDDLDIFIGATALAAGLVLVTRNSKDFVNMDGINLENWIDG